MPRTKILSSEERAIISMIAEKKTKQATMKLLEWVSRYLRIPLWKVKVIAKRRGISF